MIIPPSSFEYTTTGEPCMQDVELGWLYEEIYCSAAYPALPRDSGGHIFGLSCSWASALNFVSGVSDRLNDQLNEPGNTLVEMHWSSSL